MPKDILGVETEFIVTLVNPILVQRANGTEGVTNLLVVDDIQEGGGQLVLLGPKRAMLPEPNPMTGKPSMAERDLNPKTTIGVSYANLAGWVQLLVEERP